MDFLLDTGGYGTLHLCWSVLFALMQLTVSVFFFSSVLVLSEQDSAAAQQYSRQGCPTGLRAQLWALILNANNDPEVTRVSFCGFSCPLIF